MMSETDQRTPAEQEADAQAAENDGTKAPHAVDLDPDLDADVDPEEYGDGDDDGDPS